MIRITALSALDQVTARVYLNALFCFPLSQPSAQAAIQDHLERGLSSFAAAFPLVKGHVRSRPDHGYVEVINSESDCSPPFTTQICSAIFYDKLRESKFIIHGEEYKALAGHNKDYDDAVLAVKLSFVTGGCVMCISVHHSVVDAKGFESLSKMYAAHCSARPDVGRESEWLHDRLSLLIGARYEDSLQYHGRLHIPEDSIGSTIERSPAPCEKIPVLFEFSEQQASALRTEMGSYSNCFISNLDGVTTMVCASIIKARSELLPAKTVCSLNVAVDGRSKLLPPMPDRYLGNVVVGAYLQFDMDALTSPEAKQMLQPAAQLASKLREAIQNVDDSLIRRYITMIEAEPDIRRVRSSGPSVVPPVSYMCSSWAGLLLRSLSFAGEKGPRDLKTPEIVRIFTGGSEQLCVQPRVTMMSGTGRKISVGPLQVTTILEKECLDNLREDKLLERWCKIHSLE
jgi:hypothetical protein